VSGGQGAENVANAADAVAASTPDNSAQVRARRLSNVMPPGAGPPIQQMLQGNGSSNPEVQRPQQFNPDKLEDPGGRPVDVEVVSISRAGQDPGLKKQNQDNCFAYDFYVTPDQSLFSALDGHGPNGHMVSGYVKQHLPELLVHHLKQEEDNIPAALTEGFLDVDEKLAQSFVDCEFSGSTAVISLLKGKMLYTAWVGDSRGVLGRKTKNGMEGIDLTIDHKPSDPEEKKRIQSRNGRVERLVDEGGEPIGPPRVWLQYAWIPGLAMSRALGDKIAHTVGVISEPGISVLELYPADQFIILASDGVWEFIDSQQAVDIVSSHERLEDGVKDLIDRSYARWIEEEDGVVDDITATVVRFIHNT